MVVTLPAAIVVAFVIVCLGGSLLVGVLPMIGAIRDCLHQAAERVDAPHCAETCGHRSPVLDGFVCVAEPHAGGRHYYVKSAVAA